MPLTNAEKQARHRDRLKAKLKRLAVLEDSMRAILTMPASSADVYIIHQIARKALGDVE